MNKKCENPIMKVFMKISSQPSNPHRPVDWFMRFESITRISQYTGI